MIPWDEHIWAAVTDCMVYCFTSSCLCRLLLNWRGSQCRVKLTQRGSSTTKRCHKMAMPVRGYHSLATTIRATIRMLLTACRTDIDPMQHLLRLQHLTLQWDTAWHMMRCCTHNGLQENANCLAVPWCSMSDPALLWLRLLCNRR